MESWYEGVDVIVFGTLISRERFLCEEKLKMPLGIKASFSVSPPTTFYYLPRVTVPPRYINQI